eukprot:7858039-Alexandrium_andersonii.AAC.1
MSASLVGSEMCIRDSVGRCSPRHWDARCGRAGRDPRSAGAAAVLGGRLCLLYTSDAADDM